jgi:uncharacterized protein (DUF427 family)
MYGPHDAIGSGDCDYEPENMIRARAGPESPRRTRNRPGALTVTVSHGDCTVADTSRGHVVSEASESSM